MCGGDDRFAVLLARYRDPDAEARGDGARPGVRGGRRRAAGRGADQVGGLSRPRPHWQSIPSTWDSVWHANTVRCILDTGQASSTHMGELRNVETHEALYYPSAFHALPRCSASSPGPRRPPPTR